MLLLILPSSWSTDFPNELVDTVSLILSVSTGMRFENEYDDDGEESFGVFAVLRIW